MKGAIVLWAACPRLVAVSTEQLPTLSHGDTAMTAFMSGNKYRWWNSERFVVITRQLQAAKCSLSCQLFRHIFILLENL
jgi:hypothetical protein